MNNEQNSRPTAPEPEQQGGALRHANNLHAVLMGAHGLITMCREHFIERELAACDGNFLYAPECLTALQKINQVDKEFAQFKATPARVDEGRVGELEGALATIYHCYLKYLLPENRNALVAVQYTVKDLCEIAQKALTPPGSAPKQEGEK